MTDLCTFILRFVRGIVAVLFIPVFPITYICSGDMGVFIATLWYFCVFTIRERIASTRVCIIGGYRGYGVGVIIDFRCS